MPIYEYYCKDCQTHFEIFTTSAQSKEAVKCKQCAGANVRKNISAGSFRVGGCGASIPAPGSFSGCGANSGFK